MIRLTACLLVLLPLLLAAGEADAGRADADRLVLQALDLLGRTDRREEHLDQGMALLRTATERGSAIGAFHLALTAEQGIRQTPSATAALAWYRLAAERGHADATFIVGNRLFKGLGVEKDEAQARLWYEKAAARGQGTAALHLALMHRRGLGGLAIDQVQCFAWLRIAQALGDPDSAVLLQRFGHPLSPEESAAAAKQVSDFLAANHLAKDTP